jgi:hypothetical protein
MRPEDVTSAGMSLNEGLVAAGMGWDMALSILGRYLRGELDGPPSANAGAEPSPEDLERYGEYQQAWQQVADEALAQQQQQWRGFTGA